MSPVSPAPLTPPGWDETSERLHRLVAPGGDAVAWVCPELGANVVAYTVRTPDGWGQVLHQEGAATLRRRPSRFGLPILYPFPGHMVGARYSWRDRAYTMPLLDPSAPSYTHGFAHQRPWRVADASAATLTAVLDTRTDLEPAQRAGYPFDTLLTLHVSVARGSLDLTLVAENVGEQDAPVGIGLHPYFDPAFFGVERTALRVTVPGSRDRLLTPLPPIPTGITRGVGPDQAIAPVPHGQMMLVSRTGFGDRPAARIVADGKNPKSPAVTLSMDEGWEDVLLFAPLDGPSISIEPHTGAPGAASLAPDDPDGLRALAPGAVLTVRASIDVGLVGG